MKVLLVFLLWCTISGTSSTSADSPNNTSDPGKCKQRLDSNTSPSSGRPKIGAFVPQCAENGDFREKQCHGSTGQCWCVDPKSGQEIPNTRTKPGSAPISCNKNDAPCRVMRDRLLSENAPPGTFVPSCMADGSFSALQCHGSTGYCWCVDPKTGQEINGTKTAPGQEPSLCLESPKKVCPIGDPLKNANEEEISCSLTSDDKKCPNSYKCVPRDPSLTQAVCCKAVERPTIEPRIVDDLPKNTPPPKKTGNCKYSIFDDFVPKCTNENFFEIVQCDKNNCWCVHPETGLEIDGTKKSGEKLTCKDCLLTGPLTSDYVTCDLTPEMMNLAICPAYAKECGCITLDSLELTSTVEPGQPLKPCPLIKSLKGHCNTTFGHVETTDQPQCILNGFYSPIQCDLVKSKCWCVDPVTGNRYPEAPIDASSTQSCPSCVHARLRALQFATSEAFLPECDEKGNYVPHQCSNSTGHCFCVDSLGVIVPGTRKPIENGPPDCTKATKNVLANLLSKNEEENGDSNGTCTRHLRSVLNIHHSLVGVFVPRCDFDGSYAPVQCHGSIGNCWCVTNDGIEIHGTRMVPGSTRLDCQKERMSKKQLGNGPVFPKPAAVASRKGSSSNFPPFLKAEGPCHKTVRALSVNVEPTVFIPRCTPSGYFQSLQCHGPDLCWCSTPDGIEIEGSRVPPGCGFPDCDNLLKNATPDVPSHLKPAATEPKSPDSDNEEIYDFLPMCILPKETGPCKAKMIRYHFSPEHRTCLAFTYGGCGGNDNNFQNKSSCLQTCLPADYSSCYGNQKAYHGPLSTKAPKTDVYNHGCQSDDECPAGFKCKFAGLINFCCNETVEDEWSDSYNFQCPSNQEAFSDPEDLILLSDTCANDFCPHNFTCHENKHFAFCCIKLDLSDTTAISNPFCELPKDSGTVQPGEEPVKRWFFNTNTKNCESFQYNLNGGGNENNFQSLTQCLEKCGPNRTISSSIEPPPKQIEGKKEEEEEVVGHRHPLVCEQPKNQGVTCHGTTQKNGSVEIRWYFNKEKFACVAFKYSGCGGNGNNFRTKGQCDLKCKPQDGPNCVGGVRSYQAPNGTSLQAKNCKELVCPTGWKCRMGWIFATCCNKTVEDIFDDAYNETCKNGAKAFTISRPYWSEPYFGDTCDDLLCPSGYTCVQSSLMFAKCCSTGKVQISSNLDDDSKTVQEEKIDESFKCPIGSPVIDEWNFQFRSCDSNNTCPESSYCWTGSMTVLPEEDPTTLSGFCCSVPKIPSLLRSTISKQNCTSSTEKQLLQCALPIANLTKRLQEMGVASALKPSAFLTSTDIRVKSLNESCQIYNDYTLCTNHVFISEQQGHCYNYIDSIINAILGFVCQPKIKDLLEKYHQCLENVIENPKMKQCIAEFNQTMEQGGATDFDQGSLSFAGICFAIENFVNCSQPVVAGNCSVELSTTIVKFVQRASVAIFGGTCEQVAAADDSQILASNATEDDQSKARTSSTEDDQCTNEQADQLHQCWTSFTNNSAASHYFSPHSDPDALMRKEEVDTLDELCTTYQTFNTCASAVIATNPTCSPLVYMGLSRVIAYTCKPDVLKNWKKFGYCYAELSKQDDVQHCLEILRQAQYVYVVDRGVNLPFDQLCAGADQYIQCSKKPIAEKCGKEAADFYENSYQENKKLIFPPCLVQGLDVTTENPSPGLLQSVNDGHRRSS